MGGEGARALRITAENLAALLEALPRSIANTVRRMASTDWRERAKAKDEGEAEEQAGALPMGFTLIYESKDGKLCLYQDRDGHLIAADSGKFA